MVDLGSSQELKKIEDARKIRRNNNREFDKHLKKIRENAKLLKACEKSREIKKVAKEKQIQKKAVVKQP